MKWKQNIQNFKFRMFVDIFQNLLTIKIIKAFVSAIVFSVTESHYYNYPKQERNT